MMLNLLAAVSTQIARREAFNKGGELGTGLSGSEPGGTVNPVHCELATQLLHAHRIHAPELFQPPGRHRSWIHGADVGVSEESEFAQALFGADAGGEKPRGSWILEITPIHDERQIEMM